MKHSIALLGALVTASIASSAAAQNVQINSGFRPDPVALRGTAGGPVDGTSINAECRGHFPQQPQHRITTNGLNPVRFFTMAAGNEDVTLAIVTPTRTVYCDDDGGGNRQAMLDVRLPPGTYDVYVGTYASGEARPYSLIATTNTNLSPQNYQPSTAVVVQPTQNNGNTGNSPWNTPPNNGNGTPNNGNGNTNGNAAANAQLQRAAGLRASGPVVRLRNGGSGRARGRTGGTMRASQLSARCSAGYITMEPSHQVFLGQAAPQIEFTVASASDTTLLVLGPNGVVDCNDDREPGNFNPRILMPNAPPGTYTVWVGTYRESSRNLYQLNVTTTPR